MNFFTDQQNKLVEKVKNLKCDLLDAEQNLMAIQDLNFLVDKFGIVCDFLPPSLEDWGGFEHLFKSYDGTPIDVKYDRRWIGFHELTEYDHMQKYILPRWYEFK